MKPKDKLKNEFLDVLVKISSDKKLLDKFLGSVLSPREYKEVGVRLKVFKMTLSGYTQRQIASILKIGLATVSRGALVVKEQELIFKKIFKDVQKITKTKDI